jgi:hypothetical protein
MLHPSFDLWPSKKADYILSLCDPNNQIGAPTNPTGVLTLREKQETEYTVQVFFWPKALHASQNRILLM